jgi:predicted site-specific integrase-resolvase
MLLEYTNQLASKKDREKRKKTMPVPVVTYARVSSAKQRNDLSQQQRHLETYVTQKGWTLIKSYQDIDSRLNDKRRGLLQLLRDLLVLQPTRLVCSYEDRLARVGTRLLQTICELFSTKSGVTHQPTKQVTVNEQLVNDVLALLTSFAGKLHRARRGKQTAKNRLKARRPISKGVS